MAQNFILTPDWLADDTSIELAFEVLPWRTPLRIVFAAEGSLLIEADRLEPVSELVQHLATFFNIQHLASNIEIDDTHFKQLIDLMEGVRGLQSVRQRLTVDMADQMNEIRNSFNESENARSMNDMVELRRFYATMLSGNRQLIDLQNIRDSNYNELINRLKQINLHVQHSSSCRGTPFYFPFRLSLSTKDDFLIFFKPCCSWKVSNLCCASKSLGYQSRRFRAAHQDYFTWQQ